MISRGCHGEPSYGQHSNGLRALPADGQTANDEVYTLATKLHLDACLIQEQGKIKPRPVAMLLGAV
jgi:hypothetical protein